MNPHRESLSADRLTSGTYKFIQASAAGGRRAEIGPSGWGSAIYHFRDLLFYPLDGSMPPSFTRLSAGPACSRWI